MNNIALVGGGTGGPVSPVLAVAERLSDNQNNNLFYISNGSAIGSSMIKSADFDMHQLTIPAGKYRRYFSLKNFVDIFKVIVGFVKSIYLLKKHRIDLVFGAGSFVQVPVIWAAWILRIPAVVHQQDLEILLSTKLCLPVAKRVTTVFEASAKNIHTTSGLFRRMDKAKVIWTGNPVKKRIQEGDKRRARNLFNLSEDYPTVLIFGGGSGSKFLNDLVVESVPDLVQYVQIIHILGQKKQPADYKHEHYHAFEFLQEEMPDAYAVADLVVARGGLSTLSELSVLQKPALLIPLPDSPQEKNVQLAAFLKAAVGVRQEFLTKELLVKLIRKILWDIDLQNQMKQGMKHLNKPEATEQVLRVIKDILNEK